MIEQGRVEICRFEPQSTGVSKALKALVVGARLDNIFKDVKWCGYPTFKWFYFKAMQYSRW